jgi:hypothetical protein
METSMHSRSSKGIGEQGLENTFDREDLNKEFKANTGKSNNF